MGEIAEMMLDRTLCGDCGTLIDGEETGYPRYCCRSDRPEKEERFEIAMQKLGKQVFIQNYATKLIFISRLVNGISGLGQAKSTILL